MHILGTLLACSVCMGSGRKVDTPSESGNRMHIRDAARWEHDRTRRTPTTEPSSAALLSLLLSSKPAAAWSGSVQSPCVPLQRASMTTFRCTPVQMLFDAGYKSSYWKGGTLDDYEEFKGKDFKVIKTEKKGKKKLKAKAEAELKYGPRRYLQTEPEEWNEDFVSEEEELKARIAGRVAYNAQKTQVLADYVFLATIGCTLAWSVCDLKSFGSFVVGSLFGAGYLFLQQRSVDKVGAEAGQGGGAPSLVAPLLLVAIAVKQNLEVLPALIGFFQFIFAIIYQAVYPSEYFYPSQEQLTKLKAPMTTLDKLEQLLKESTPEEQQSPATKTSVQ